MVGLDAWPECAARSGVEAGDVRRARRFRHGISGRVLTCGIGFGPLRIFDRELVGAVEQLIATSSCRWCGNLESHRRTPPRRPAYVSIDGDPHRPRSHPSGCAVVSATMYRWSEHEDRIERGDRFAAPACSKTSCRPSFSGRQSAEQLVVSCRLCAADAAKKLPCGGAS
jgi:hypothetical protein